MKIKSPRDVQDHNDGVIRPRVSESARLAKFWNELGVVPVTVKSGVENEVIAEEFLLADHVRASDLVDYWGQVLRESRESSLVDLILVEFWFSIGVAKVVDALPWPLTYSKTLLTIRQRVGLALYSHAQGVNWRRPVHFVALLRIARAYLRDAVGNQAELREDYRKEFTGRLGVSTALMSRFDEISLRDLNEAKTALRESIVQGNDDVAAHEYLTEVHCGIYDLEPNKLLLEQAIEAAEVALLAVQSVRLQHGLAELLLRSGTAPWRLQLDRIAISEARTRVRSTEPQNAEDRVRAVLLIGIADWILEVGDLALGVKHARIPFGLRVGGGFRAESLVNAANHIEGPLKGLAKARDPLVVGIAADYLILTGERLGMSRVDVLREVVSLRSDGANLSDRRSRLLCGRDQLDLAGLTNDRNLRERAVRSLAELANSDARDPSPLLILARDLENNGRFPLPIDVGTPRLSAMALRRVALGEIEGLYEEAGGRALASPDLSVQDLGGRSGVYSVADYYGLSSETFVFKSEPVELAVHERCRSGSIESHLAERGLLSSFGVSRTLATYAREDEDEAVVARHYVQGRPLSQIVHLRDLGGQIELLTQASEFLAHINNCEGISEATSVRRNLKTRDVGRWFRIVDPQRGGEYFDRWWSLVEDCEVLKKRDAHLDNWLQSDDGKIVAIDLESKGARPVGYELAQITDDHSAIDPGNWAARVAIFEAYCAVRGFTREEEASAWRGFQAGILARLVWALTAPEGVGSSVESPAGRLEIFAQTAPLDEVAVIARDVLSSWTRSRGQSRATISTKRTVGAGRVRLSKSIAYHLRHNEKLERDGGGWSSIDQVQDVLGEGVTLDEIAAVVTHRSESRFEFAAGSIRAKYGHSVPVELDFLTARPESYLYHASPWIQANHVIHDRQGISVMGRRFVHLSSDLKEAFRAGVRKGHPLVYGVPVDPGMLVLQASDHTLLSPAIAFDRLRVVPLSYVWAQVPPVASLVRLGEHE
ncbi:RNA 2'-phosphotransferase [Oerskovia jenensis]|uniref:RNA:NAD 2'-phosphotransferase (TPT1/KptA family) n=1 Tax=Oerskovia jenensis TaxID=162169 RepID=A0ABS2L9Q9_9CELL|nr:RNA 2'-phosphotransferase [Oerskovia jenensis]MBM7477163.1 RNA:NAD 2'-phosphotransferase (TPT1/KptA family) [Oerskovia jenensis]